MAEDATVCCAGSLPFTWEHRLPWTAAAGRSPAGISSAQSGGFLRIADLARGTVHQLVVAEAPGEPDRAGVFFKAHPHIADVLHAVERRVDRTARVIVEHHIERGRERQGLFQEESLDADAAPVEARAVLEIALVGELPPAVGRESQVGRGIHFGIDPIAAFKDIAFLVSFVIIDDRPAVASVHEDHESPYLVESQVGGET